jgi:hypothetical protein
MRRVRLAGIVAAAVLAAGCLVEIQKVTDPGPAFARARAEAARVQGRPGPPGSLHVLVWDRGEEKLVRVSVPMWLVRKAAEHDDTDLDFDDDSGEVARHVRPHLRWKDVEKAGLGVLAEVEEEDGDQVLVWLS